MWYCATGNVDRSYFQQNELLIYFFSFLWHKIIALISNMFIYAKIAIKKNCWNARRQQDASDIDPSSLVFYTQHRVNTTIYELFIYIQTCVNVNTGLGQLPPIPQFFLFHFYFLFILFCLFENMRNKYAKIQMKLFKLLISWIFYFVC